MLAFEQSKHNLASMHKVAKAEAPRRKNGVRKNGVSVRFHVLPQTTRRLFALTNPYTDDIARALFGPFRRTPLNRLF
jgi:hypothetical protein